MSDTIRVLVGYDPREAVAYHTCCQSIIANCSRPQDLAFTPVTGPQHDGSNRFIYARFEPFTRPGPPCIFIDGDMTVLGDIAELWALFDPRYAVQVVKHEYRTKFPVKYWGQKNADYSCKNWSSVMIMNPSHLAHCGAPRLAIRDAIDTGAGKFLHRFAWLPPELIGSLPVQWNWLAKEYPFAADAKLVHHTVGLPIDPAGEGDPWAADWNEHFLAAVRYRP